MNAPQPKAHGGRLLAALLPLLALCILPPATAAPQPDPCSDYQRSTRITDGAAGSTVTVIPLEERVPAALLCLHRLRADLQDTARDSERYRSLRQKLSTMEEDLRNIGKRLDRIIASRCYCMDKHDSYQRYLHDINSYFRIPEHDRLYIGHSDYDRYFFKLSLGYEYTSISTLLKESSPRLGLLIHHHYGRRPYHDEYGRGLFGLQLSGNLILSGASEQKPADTASSNGEESRTLGADIALFAPLIRSKIRPDLALQTGLIAAIGATRTDLSAKIKARSYIGGRSALSPLHYIDVLFGSSPGLDSTRMEIRGQMPVANIGRGSRLFLGAVANMAVLNKQLDEDDLLTVYFSWNIDFLNLFATGG